MNKIAKFEKISKKQLFRDGDFFTKDIAVDDSYKSLERINEFLYGTLEDLKMPKRATKMSAGYDICSPINVRVKAGEPFVIPTGLRCFFNQKDWVLMIYPRSGLGFKYGMRLVNTCGIIDADYVYAENEGHILLKFVSDKDFEIHEGDRIAQGVFLKYGITVDDKAEGQRTGGIGSTGV